jgi:hypothetical protein
MRSAVVFLRISVFVTSLALVVSGCGMDFVPCTEFRFRESVNRSPVTGVEMRVRSLWGDQPLLSRENSYIPVPLCSGSYEVEFSHPLYQTKTITHTSPRDRSQSGNTQVDVSEVILTLR